MAENRSGGGGGCFSLIAICLALAFCNHRSTTETRASEASSFAALSPQGDEMTDARDATSISSDEQTDDDADDPEPSTLIGGETYEEYDARRDALNTGRFSGDEECTQDCSGHDAGHLWAEQRGITDPDECGGNSWSFVEGCRSFAEEQQPLMPDGEVETETETGY